MENINRLRKNYSLLNSLCEIRVSEPNNSSLCSEINKVTQELLKNVGDLLSNELNECNCDGVHSGCSSLLCKCNLGVLTKDSECDMSSLNSASVSSSKDSDMIYDDSFYITIPQLPYLKSYMFRSISEFNGNCFIEMYEFGKNDFILPMVLDNLMDNEFEFDIQIRKSGCGYTEIWKNVKITRVHRQELRRCEIGCTPNPSVIYVECEFEDKEYIENAD